MLEENYCEKNTNCFVCYVYLYLLLGVFLRVQNH